MSLSINQWLLIDSQRDLCQKNQLFETDNLTTVVKWEQNSDGSINSHEMNWNAYQSLFVAHF